MREKPAVTLSEVPADVEVGAICTDFDTSISESEMDVRTGVLYFPHARKFKGSEGNSSVSDSQ